MGSYWSILRKKFLREDSYRGILMAEYAYRVILMKGILMDVC